MIRIAGVNIPEEKSIEIALTYIFGVGRSLSNEILTAVKIEPQKRAKTLNAQEVNMLKGVIEKYKVEGELRRERMMNIKRLKDIHSYRGSRHSKHLPSRGQKTKTNSRTLRGNVRKTMTSGRRPTSQKT